MEPLIQVRDLRKHFTSGVFRTREVRAVDGVSFDLARGETLGIMGESGCGKSTLARLLARLIAPTSGQIRLAGADFLAARGEELRQLRRRVQIVFQDAEGTLDPRMRLGDLLVEPLRVHGLLDAPTQATTERLLHLVNLTPDLLDRFPHQLSGGQRQRVGIARSVSLNPDLIVADEPAASLDLSIQAQLLDLLRRIQAEHGTGLVLITHNLKVLRLLCDRVAVMYLGRFVELGPTARVFSDPAHPYTRALVDAAPSRRQLTDRFTLLDGEPPSPLDPPSGCHLHPRCPYADHTCQRLCPPLVGRERLVACHHADPD